MVVVSVIGFRNSGGHSHDGAQQCHGLDAKQRGHDVGVSGLAGHDDAGAENPIGRLPRKRSL